LEEDDSDVDSLQYLIEHDHDFSALLNPSDDDEDTALLLSSGRPYQPLAVQTVRSRTEVEASDQLRERERAVHDKLMSRLKTLQLEVRSTTRGIDVLESFLNGSGSSDENSEFVDDAERREYLRRLRKEEENQRLRLERKIRRKMQSGNSPPSWVEWCLRWGFLAFLVILIWYGLELAVL
jgi:hypothetical protein